MKVEKIANKHFRLIPENDDDQLYLKENWMDLDGKDYITWSSGIITTSRGWDITGTNFIRYRKPTLLEQVKRQTLNQQKNLLIRLNDLINTRIKLVDKRYE
jgi:hypothetical protein